jgi:hypothetical protein
MVNSFLLILLETGGPVQNNFISKQWQWDYPMSLEGQEGISNVF